MEAVENYCSKTWRSFLLHQLSSYWLALLCFLVFLLLLENSDVYWEVVVNTRFEEASSSPSPAHRCNGKRIYMYPLPAKFKTQILEQCDKQLAHWINFCPHVENEGFGKYINNSAFDSWYRTDPYMLEVIFHARMQSYPCLTKSRLQADAFFIPYYSGLDALRLLYGKDKAGDQGKEVVAWLEEEASMRWRRRGGDDHFIVMGRTAWDFSRDLNIKEGWGTSFNVLPEMENVTSLFLERRAWQPSSSKEQAIPYPTSFHPPSLSALQAWLSHVRLHPRSYLFSFSGASRSADSMGSIRNVILDECLHSNSECALVNCHDIRCAHNPQPIMQAFLESQFCLQPPGDTPTRRSTFDGLIAGCIPVFFQNESAYTQYTWHLSGDPTLYSVFISQADIVEGGRRIKDVLETYSRERILQMRENIISLIHGLIYISSSTASEMPLYPDAFTLSLEGMLRKVQDKSLL